MCVCACIWLQLSIQHCIQYKHWQSLIWPVSTFLKVEWDLTVPGLPNTIQWGRSVGRFTIMNIFVGLSVFCQIIHFPWTPSWTFFSIKMWILWWSKSWCSFLDQMFRPWVWVSSRQLEQVLLQKSWHKWLLFLNIRNMEFLCRPTTRRNSFTCVTPDAPSFLLFHCSNMREVMNCSIFLPMTPKSIS